MSNPTKLPSTIHRPDAFIKSPAAGADGVFNWDWTKGCFDKANKISPMDFDGVVERNGNFILFETKDVGTAIPRGQFITLKAAHDQGCWTIMLIEGKHLPERGRIWWPGSKISRDYMGHEWFGLESAIGLVRSWYLKADTGCPF